MYKTMRRDKKNSSNRRIKKEAGQPASLNMKLHLKPFRLVNMNKLNLHVYKFSVKILGFERSLSNWSEWRDLNPRPLVPQTSALPGCATLRPIKSDELLSRSF